MGLYLETGDRHGKAQAIQEQMGGVQIAEPVPLADVPADSVQVCVVDNDHWDAALIVADEIDYRRATNPQETRPLTWLLVPREKVIANVRANHSGNAEKDLRYYGVIPVG